VRRDRSHCQGELNWWGRFGRKNGRPRREEKGRKERK